MIDASIPLGFRPAKPESPLNALAQYSQIQGLQNQNRLADLSMQEKQRAIADEANLTGLMRNALNPATGEFDPAILNGLIAEKGTYGQMSAFQKQQLDHKKTQSGIDKDLAEAQEKQYKIAKDVYGLMGDAAGAIERAPTYENAVLVINNMKKLLPPAVAEKITLDDIPRDPAQIKQWATNHKMQVISADKQQEDERIRSEGALGRAVTMRGQNMTAQTAAESRAQADRHFGVSHAVEAKPLAAPVLKQLTEVRDNATTINNLATTFKPEYAGKGVFGMGADLQMDASARMGADKNAVEWWKNYKKQAELVERHAMFGASLTPGEQNSWRSADISPGMNSEVIERNLATRKALTQKMFENSTQDFIDAGHNAERITKIAGRGGATKPPGPAAKVPANVQSLLDKYK